MQNESIDPLIEALVSALGGLAEEAATIAARRTRPTRGGVRRRLQRLVRVARDMATLAAALDWAVAHNKD